MLIPEFSPDLIEKTIKVWSKYTSKVVTPEDARQILVNTIEFFSLLAAKAGKHYEQEELPPTK